MNEHISIFNKNIAIPIIALILIFIFDTFTPRGHLDWIFYIILLLYISIRVNKNQIVIVGVISIVFLFLGFILSPDGIDFKFALYNRFVGSLILLIIIWVSMRLKKDNEEIMNALHEKEVLIKETHHRIKNNLQLVTSLLNLQANQTENEEVKSHLNDSKNRIKSIALIHEKLYNSISQSNVNLKDYITDLMEALIKTYNSNLIKIDLKMDIDDSEMDSRTAIILGLIVNELCTNSLKYAFLNRNSGMIFLSVKADNEIGKKLIYRDNGVGLPANFNFSKTKSLGMQLISSFIEQIGGTIKINNENGLEYFLTFPSKAEEEN